MEKNTEYKANITIQLDEIIAAIILETLINYDIKTTQEEIMKLTDKIKKSEILKKAISNMIK